MNRDLLYAFAWVAFAVIVTWAAGARVWWCLAPLLFVLARLGADFKREGHM